MQPTTNQGWVYTDRITPTDAGLPVLEFYATRYRHSSRAAWCDRITSGQIRQNGHPMSPDDRLQAGQTLAYHRPPWQEPEAPLGFAVLYEDDDVMAIAKPAGLPVLPGGNFLTHTLLHQLKLCYPENTPVPVHRLGRGTSGVMVLGRSTLARSVLSRQLRDSTAAVCAPQAPHPIRKTYRALVGPSDLPDTFTITTPIGKVDHPVLGYVYAANPAGLPAYSDGRVLRRSPDSTLVEVTIRTGRPHQIRIHLAAAGFPLLGDPLYGVGGVPLETEMSINGEIPVPGDIGYHLHAYRLELKHPRTQETLEIISQPPKVLADHRG
ncbi:RluA family pseudouridine synthase [Nodosilinea sp. LEGE 07088]|uniref:RluA family pseudouridine synthase n=1 Tax=Nodosilinea sp. LEGE 07088 TaxID=2777968 RepID=UPI0018831154|nr:RluA family pseudouridine synthase [Nodosilinea sp. LEGE 07088]MBE9140316.1 RluA family pseudouridine synthase [Nodosilinea sp. LEGE 07088]